MAEAAAAPATANPVFIKLRRDGVQSGMFIDPELPNPQIHKHITPFANRILRSSAESPRFGVQLPRFVALGSRFGAKVPEAMGARSARVEPGSAKSGAASTAPAALALRCSGETHRYATGADRRPGASKISC